jgi:crotonobetainyl-CoA:carnitine CoA-transferase CaiB-like acyl-CoA transferase
MEAVSGIQSLSAYQAGETPRRIREMDVTNGIMGACATLTALLKCQQTGEGEWIDLSQMEAATHALIGEHFLEYATNGSYSPPRGNRHATHAPQGCYRCQGEDKWIAISIRSEQEWQSLCTVIGQPQLVDNPQFFTCVERMNNHSQLDQLIEEWSIQHTHIEAMHLLQKAGIAAGAVLNVAEIAQDPHLKERGYFQTLNSNGEINFPGFPFRLAKGSGVIDTAGPELGEHNRYVICELLGQPEEQVKPLMEDEVRTFFAVDTE